MVSTTFKLPSGYCYFTDSFDEACDYAVRQVLIDETTPRAKELAEKKLWVGEGIVLALRTSKLKDRIEIDPVGMQLLERIKANKAEDISTVTEHGKPYRVKGDISRKYVDMYRAIPLATNSGHVVALQMTIELLLKNGLLKLVEGYDLP